MVAEHARSCLGDTHFSCARPLGLHSLPYLRDEEAGLALGNSPLAMMAEADGSFSSTTSEEPQVPCSCCVCTESVT